MADYIDREKIFSIWRSIPAPASVTSLAAAISQTPAADVAPVVRCRECKHFNLETHECENEALSTDHEGGASYSLNFYDDDFCSYGERRTTDAE